MENEYSSDDAIIFAIDELISMGFHKTKGEFSGMTSNLWIRLTLS